MKPFSDVFASRPAAFSRISITPDKPWLAPLAGYSDLAFRLLCREQGAAICETEMISAKGLCYNNTHTSRLLMTACDDEPLVVQLFGGEEESAAQAVRILRMAGFNVFDFNMGCPVRKVLRQNAGAALMADFRLAMRIVKAMLKAANETGNGLPQEPAIIGFKLRLPPQLEQLADFAHGLEDLGASWLTLHPRFASQGYGGNADWQQIVRLVEYVSVPVVASGDLFSAQDGANCLRATGAAAVMYARGALYDPAIFRKHIALYDGDEPPQTDVHGLLAIILRHMELTRRYDEERHGFVKMRSILPRYARKQPGVGELRRKLCQCQSWQELETAVEEFLSHVETREEM